MSPSPFRPTSATYTQVVVTREPPPADRRYAAALLRLGRCLSRRAEARARRKQNRRPSADPVAHSCGRCPRKTLRSVSPEDPGRPEDPVYVTRSPRRLSLRLHPPIVRGPLLAIAVWRRGGFRFLRRRLGHFVNPHPSRSEGIFADGPGFADSPAVSGFLTSREEAAGDRVLQP